MPDKLESLAEGLHKALRADAHRPRHERRTARALHAELRAPDHDGGHGRLTDHIPAWRDEQGSATAGMSPPGARK